MPTSPQAVAVSTRLVASPPENSRAASPAQPSPRVALEGLSPVVDGGRFPTKRIAGEPVTVEVDAFADGHDAVTCVLWHRAGTGPWRSTAMQPLGNDRFQGTFTPEAPGRHTFRIEAWAGDERGASTMGAEAPLWADHPSARASAWYEMFARSASPDPSRHGTLADVEARLPYVASLGFDVLYLPPIHPIGRSHRKGRNNALVAGPDDPGSPWAIGSDDGGHTAIHPELGTLADFDRLVAAARRHGIDIALDLALQCSPDHPWIREHPEWFRWRADGTVACAENPPKRYEDVVPFDFASPAAPQLWEALAGIVEFWVAHGVRRFRVDNPHTKPFSFWEWLIARVQAARPDVQFLAEAFTRPKVMRRLAKAGFTHSYTYFAWRNTSEELRDYVTELQRPEWSDVLRPHFWPNTPDILTPTLQDGGRTACALRFVLAATLAANYGVYGPVLELGEVRALERGKEEYLDSEKYEARHWDLRDPPLAPLLRAVNAARRAEAAFTHDASLRFHGMDNPNLLAYSRRPRDGEPGHAVLCIVNLDPRHAQSGWTRLDLGALGLPGDAAAPFVVEDLLDGARYAWGGPHNYVRLDPAKAPAHLLRIVEASA